MLQVRYTYWLFLICLISTNLFSQSPDSIYLNSDLEQVHFEDDDWNNTIDDTEYTGAGEAYQRSKVEHKEFDEEHWKEVIDGVEYTDTEEPEEEEEPILEERNQWDPEMAAFWSSFFKIFTIILGIGLIVILLANFSGADIFRPKAKKINQKIDNLSIEEIEENFQETDIISYIDKAIQDKNYPLAVRLYFLETIKALDANEHIKWKKDKTNLTYLYEIKNSNIADNFKKATRIFERVWYGEEPLGEQAFSSIQNHFKSLIKSTNPA